MKRKSITVKLFLITSTFFILFLFLVAASQTLFFQKFYLKQKINRLEKNLEEFSLKYDNETWDTLEINKNISKFINKNNAQLAILDNKAAAKHLPSFNVVIETDDKKNVMVLLNSMLLIENMQKLNPMIGTTIALEGVYSGREENILYPYSIEGNGHRWQVLKPTVSIIGEVIENSNVIELNEKPASTMVSAVRAINVDTSGLLYKIGGVGVISDALQIDMKEIKGKVVEINYPQQSSYGIPYSQEMLWTAMDHWFWVSKDKDFEINTDEIISYQYKNPTNGIDSIIMIKPIFHNGSLKEMIFAMSSLQPVGEAIGVMKDYYIYGFIGAAFIIIALSYIYSRLVANPLIKINNAALRMANLDFSVECDIKSDDEIGNLATSINVLSSNLNMNMKSLQDTNEKLKLEIEKERNLEKMRKEFVSSVSHELKTPLGIMRGFTEGLKDEVAVEKKDYYIDVILEEIQNMDALVLDMLELSKLESNAIILKLESFDIVNLFELVEDRFIQQLEEKSIRIKYLCSEEPLMVNGDKKRIEQVIINIITNAIRHTRDEGTIKIDIMKQEEDKIYIAIENQGDNIQEDKLNFIWDRFYRAEEARDRKSGGTGLGLAIVKNILELHNSEYGAINTDMGVRFFFTLTHK